MMSFIWITIQVLIGYNLVFPMILYLAYQLRRSHGEKTLTSNDRYDYAIIVTAYEQTHLLKSVVESLLKLNYQNYHIYIVADNCDISGLLFSSEKVSVLRPKEVLANNLGSHFYAINRFIREHDVLTIIDSDNLVHPEYINELNTYFERGFVAVQGVRKAKNLNTTIACLDAARDIYYDFYDGEVLFKLGSSSTLAGSGMAFKSEIYKQCLADVTVTGAGFDKVLQAQLLRKGFRIAHAPEAIVYDEKTAHSDQLVNQRSRWINTWFKYARFGVELVLRGIQNKSVNQFLFGVVLMRPPLFIFLLLSIVCLGINVFINIPMALIWLLGLLVFVLSFIIVLEKKKCNKEIYKSLASIPKFIYFQLVALYYLRVANKKSVATKHSSLNTIQ